MDLWTSRGIKQKGILLIKLCITAFLYLCTFPSRENNSLGPRIITPALCICRYTLHERTASVVRQPSSSDLFTHYTCSGSLSCSRPLCLRVVWRIFTSSTGLQDDSRGISSKSLSTKLSCRWGSSVRKSLRVAGNMEWRNSEMRASETWTVRLAGLHGTTKQWDSALLLTVNDYHSCCSLAGSTNTSNIYKMKREECNKMYQRQNTDI